METKSLPSHWRAASIDDCMSAILDYRGKSPHKTTTGIPLVTAKVVRNGRLLRPDEFIAPKSFDAWMRRGLPRAGDVVMTTEAPLGEVAQLGTERVALAQRLVTLRGKHGVLDDTFLKFAMQSTFVQAQLRARATGTTVLGIRQSELRKVMLPLPPIGEQRAIAGILGALDAKIELNTRMNETLEATARAIFKSWFVDFDPVRAKAGGDSLVVNERILQLFPSYFARLDGEYLPVGWNLVPLATVAKLNGWTLRSSDELDPIEYIDISSVSRGEVQDVQVFVRGTEPSRARRRVQHGDTVLSTVRPERASYFLAMEPPSNLVVSTGFVTVTPEGIPWSYVYAALARDEVFEQLGHLAHGGAYPAVNPSVVGQIRVPMPSDHRIMDAFHRFVSPFYERAALNRRETRTLGALRDALLPKLMSGEVRVNDSRYSESSANA